MITSLLRTVTFLGEKKNRFCRYITINGTQIYFIHCDGTIYLKHPYAPRDHVRQIKATQTEHEAGIKGRCSYF